MINGADTAWVLMSAALVLMMTPALAFFYGGMVRRKNVSATLMQCLIIVALISVQWVLFGYSLAFGPDKGHFIGSLSWAGLSNVGMEPSSYAPTIPHQAYMVFQMMFAIITPALIIGAFAERMKFKVLLIFVLVWSTIVYDPIAHWVWAENGWLRNQGALDFAGGTVVHISAGLAALAAALAIKPRRGFGKEAMEPGNMPFIVLGAGLLWFGWFGFNAGSALASGTLAVSAFVVTNTAAAMGGLSWMTMTWMFGGKPSIIGAASGAIAGLVAITPASGYVKPMPALIIGLGAGIFCYLALRLRSRYLKLDDSLDVWACHGVGGIWGAVATGLFATVAVNAAGGNGAFYGHLGQLGTQLEAIAVVSAYSFGLTFIILKVLDRVIGVNVSEEDEMSGLDLSQHGERAYEA